MFEVVSESIMPDFNNLLTNECMKGQRQVPSIPLVPQPPGPSLAKAADFTLAATPLAAVAGEASQDITATP